MEISPLARRSFSQKKRIFICLLVGPVARPLEIIAKVLLLSCSIISDFLLGFLNILLRRHWLPPILILHLI